MAKKTKLPPPETIFAMADEKGRIAVKVTPNAGENTILMPAEAPEAAQLQVRVTATPEDGKANGAVLKLLSKALGVPKSALTIVHGSKARVKTIEISR
ncbi:DUF167 domain-containing protein [Parasphingorhabdus sp.]|uniref:DUF167 domain-containing protein n=1 Tax=Parasphingorhabdus sp. TaxID=2709688 RepID=UPI002F94B726